jgi:hypothetical protein
MRFIAPERAALADDSFSLPVFAGLSSFEALLRGPAWPSLDDLNSILAPARHALTGQRLSLAAQEVLEDADNYERRILHRGVIATRSENWHDLFNALVWKRFPAIKSALNAGQVDDMQEVGLAQRTRRQCAFTQFDEAGAVLVLRDAALLDSWDRHDWTEFFLGQREAWRDGRIHVEVFGHALFEHALNPAMLLVSKTLVIVDPDSRMRDTADIDACIAAAISARACLADPQHLRPLPMSGIPGWHRAAQDAEFYLRQPCFRPRREGRIYPAPLPAIALNEALA